MKTHHIYFHLCLTLLLITAFEAIAQKYSIPGAAKQPAWVFPIWFKDNKGARDTIYLGYDSLATGNLDTIFGMKYIKIDTLKFNAGFSGFYGDTALKVLVYPKQLLGFSIEFLKAKMPFTMYWDDSLFYSDSLPFPDLSPLPRARGDMWCNDWHPLYYNCPVGYAIQMSDKPDTVWPHPIFYWWAIGSKKFAGDTSDYMGTSLDIRIVPYDASTSGIEEIEKKDLFKVVPIPFNDVITIEPNVQINFSYKIFDIFGRECLKSGKSDNQVQVNTNTLLKGFYFLQLITKNQTVIKKLMKL